MTRGLALSCALLSASAVAEPRRASLAVLPFSAEKLETDVDLLVEWHTVAALAASGRYAVYHPKQVRELLRQEGLDPDAPVARADAPRLLEGLGVERGVFAQLTRVGVGYRLEGAVSGATGAARAFSVTLPDGLAPSIAKAAEDVAAAVDALWQQHLAPATVPQVYRENLVHPKSWARCLERLNRLPTSLDHPGVVTAAELDDLVVSCRVAAQQNPAHAPTLSALALALATAGDDVEAGRLIGQLGSAGEPLPLWWLARFWLAARYDSGDHGLQVLEHAARVHPEQLIFPALRVELLERLGRPTAALDAARSYQALLPGSAPALGHLARALSGVGRHDEAVERAREAAAAFRSGRQARLELATQLLKVGGGAEALTLLEGLRRDGPASEVAHVRLAEAQLSLGRADAALRQAKLALSGAASPHAWLPRGRAWYELAVAAAHARAPELARLALGASRATGFEPPQLDPWLEPLTLDLDAEAPERPQTPALEVLSPLDFRVPSPKPAPESKRLPRWFAPAVPGLERSPFTSGPVLER
ncbi:MAG: hypothetical protein JNK82_28215 [Myxococcaceae bacterium]|nr:hypothetical protein [Myxococcaceae bacterium]